MESISPTFGFHSVAQVRNSLDPQNEQKIANFFFHTLYTEEYWPTSTKVLLLTNDHLCRKLIGAEKANKHGHYNIFATNYFTNVDRELLCIAHSFSTPSLRGITFLNFALH